MIGNIATSFAIIVGGVPILLLGMGKIRAMKTEEAQRAFLEKRARFFRIVGTLQIVWGVTQLVLLWPH